MGKLVKLLTAQLWSWCYQSSANNINSSISVVSLNTANFTTNQDAIFNQISFSFLFCSCIRKTFWPPGSDSCIFIQVSQTQLPAPNGSILFLDRLPKIAQLVAFLFRPELLSRRIQIALTFECQLSIRLEHSVTFRVLFIILKAFALTF